MSPLFIAVSRLCPMKSGPVPAGWVCALLGGTHDTECGDQYEIGIIGLVSIPFSVVSFCEDVVAKLIARPRPEQIVQQAQYYVKSYILLPSGIVGLICMIGGVGGLGYQLLATDNYTWGTFYQSTGLIVLGVTMGLVQTRYHQFVLAQFPEVLAARMRMATAKKAR